LRIIRIIRLIRIVKLYKNALLARANIEKNKKEKEEQMKKELEDNSNSISQINSPISASRRISNINPSAPSIVNTPNSSIS
jgi:hypothetical protein